MSSITQKSFAFRIALGLVAELQFQRSTILHLRVRSARSLSLLCSHRISLYWSYLGSKWLACSRTYLGVHTIAHLVKHILGLPDTLHPNTYTSIMMLATFTLVILAIGNWLWNIDTQFNNKGKRKWLINRLTRRSS